ncbi:hypothetical protein ACVIW0_001408 [Bradyrhizobium sp. USDA 4454]
MESKTVATRLEAFFEEFVDQLLLKDFESILTVNHPYRFRDAIVDLARRISYTPDTMQVLAEEYTASSMAADVEDGRMAAADDQVAHVRLASAEILYRYLDRTPASRIAQDAAAMLAAGSALRDSLKNSASQIAEVWGRGKTWHGFASSDVEMLRDAFVLAQAILDDKHLDVDYKTFSRRTVGHSKTLERIEGAVVRLLSGILEFPPGARPREALRAIGLERFAPPLLLAGKIDLEGADLSRISPHYLGITPKEADRVRFREPPAYILTIENFASFNRHIAEADPRRLGTTMYVGGYPSLATQQALRMIAGSVSEQTPIFHWSDIDPDGTWIFHTIERAIGRPIRPHLMSVEIAERSGQCRPKNLHPPDAHQSPVSRGWQRTWQKMEPRRLSRKNSIPFCQSFVRKSVSV